MKRTTTIVVATAAVLGLSGGAVTAVVKGDPSATPTAHAGRGAAPGRASAPTSEPAAPASEPAAPSGGSPATTKPSAQLPATLLYANPGVIHDGAKRIVFDDNVPKVPERPVPRRLVRAKGGYLVCYDTSDQEPAEDLYFIDDAGHRTHVGQVTAQWALSPQGDRVAAVDLTTGKLEVLDLTGKVIAMRAHTSDTPGWTSIAWQRNSVLLNAAGPDKQWQLYQWLPDTGTFTQVHSDLGMAAAQVSPDGSTMVGQTKPGTSRAVGDANTCMSGGPVFGSWQKRWTTCDWRMNDVPHAFSPSGDRVLARLAASDDAGPWRMAVMQATAGPTDSMTVVKLPDRSEDVQWLDESHLVTEVPIGVGSPDSPPDVWLKSCDLHSHCTTLLKSREGRIVLGEQS